MNKIKKGISSITGSGITLTNNEIKGIIRVIMSLKNGGNLLKGSTRKITSQEEGFLNFLRQLMTAGLPLMKSVLTPLAESLLIPKRVLISKGLSAGMSTSYAAIQKKIYGSGLHSDSASGAAAFIISNEEMEDIMKIVKSLVKDISETIRIEAKEPNGRFLPILLGTLAASILGNALTGNGVIRAGQGLVSVDQNF